MSLLQFSFKLFEQSNARSYHYKRRVLCVLRIIMPEQASEERDMRKKRHTYTLMGLRDVAHASENYRAAVRYHRARTHLVHRNLVHLHKPA